MLDMKKWFLIWLGASAISANVSAVEVDGQVPENYMAQIEREELRAHAFETGVHSDEFAQQWNEPWPDGRLQPIAAEAEKRVRVAEPATLALLGLGLAGIGLARRSRR